MLRNLGLNPDATADPLDDEVTSLSLRILICKWGNGERLFLGVVGRNE